MSGSSQLQQLQQGQQDQQQQQGGFHAKYELSDVIGVGSTSTVHRCLERATGKEFACKIIDKRMIETRFRGLLDQFQVGLLLDEWSGWTEGRSKAVVWCGVSRRPHNRRY